MIPAFAYVAAVSDALLMALALLPIRYVLLAIGYRPQLLAVAHWQSLPERHRIARRRPRNLAFTLAIWTRRLVAALFLAPALNTLLLALDSGGFVSGIGIALLVIVWAACAAFVLDRVVTGAIKRALEPSATLT